jgi:hypothetical protein
MACAPWQLRPLAYAHSRVVNRSKMAENWDFFAIATSKQSRVRRR